MKKEVGFYFSVVVPTLDEEDFLPNLLKDLARQSFKNFEVIVVDGQSADKTVEKAKDFENKMALSTLVVKRKNVAYQRNFGAKRAKGKWVVFMDADNRIEANFLQKLKKSIEKNKNVDVFSCLVNNNAYDKKSHLLLIRSFNNALRLSEKISPQAPGSLIGIKKELTDEFSFDESKKSAEDRFFIDNICKKGYKYDLFEDPRYKFSLRRFEKEGPPLILKFCVNTLRFFWGYDFETDADFYPMKGGKYYKRTLKMKNRR